MNSWNNFVFWYYSVGRTYLRDPEVAWFVWQTFVAHEWRDMSDLEALPAPVKAI